MNDAAILYEFPLTERVRLFLRLEQLFRQIDHHSRCDSVWDSRAAVAGLLDLLSIFTRNDMKSEILKEIDRSNQAFNKLASSPEVDQGKLAGVLADLAAISGQLYEDTGKIGRRLMESELFKSISQRRSIPGGLCAFDLPVFHYWLEQDLPRRKSDIDRWLQPFAPVRSALELLMGLLRSSARTTEEVAHGGFYQKTLDLGLSFQLLRVIIANGYPCFVEMSGSRHRLTLRFLEGNVDERPNSYAEDVPFRLGCCVL